MQIHTLFFLYSVLCICFEIYNIETSEILFFIITIIFFSFLLKAFSLCSDIFILLLFFLCSAYVNEERPRGQVIKFASGDDLEDDFFTDDKHGGNKDGSESKVSSASNSKESCVKPKKKQGPSIVNFVD